MNRKFSRVISVVVAACMIAMMVTACSGNTQTNGNSTSAPAAAATPNGGASASVTTPAQESTPQAEPPFEISWMTTFSTTEPPSADNPIIKALEELGNVKLNFSFSPQAAYSEKLNVTIASGDLLMVTLIGGNGKPSTIEVDAVRGGMFWKIEDYIGDYDWNLNPDVWANATVDGALWGLFRERSIARDGFIYRLDWMEKLGLEAPKDMDELYNMLDMFVHNDPDGNGKDDTGGLACQSGLGGILAAIGPYYGLGNQWDVIEGKVLPIHMNPQYLEVLKFIKRLYDDGLMNSDFPTVNDAQRDEMMASGMWGMEMVSIDKGSKAIVAMQKIFPDSDFTIQQLFANDDDPYIWARSGFDGKYYFSTKAIKDEAMLRRVLDYFNVQAQNGSLITNGIEGVHYTLVKPGEISVSEAQSTLGNTEVSSVGQLGFRNLEPLKRVDLTPYKTRVNAVVDDPTYCRPDPTAPFESETYNLKGTDLNLIISDAAIKFVTGAIDEAGWLAEVERWRSNGGDQIIADYQAQYDALKK